MAQREAVRITGAWLRHEGPEGSGDAVVLLEIEGEWVEVMRENLFGAFSHIIEPLGIQAKRSGGGTVDAQ